MRKTEYKAIIFDGRTHIERRVYEDERGIRNVKINGCFFEVSWLRTHGNDVDVWYDGK